MTVQITRISLFQTAKVIGALYFFGACVGVAFMLLASIVSQTMRANLSFGTVLLAPLIYALVGFVFTFVLAWVYNLVAKVVGGIEYTTTEARDF